MSILGCGGMSGQHAHRFKSMSDVEIVALCDVSEEVVNAYIDRNLSGIEPRPAVFTDAATMYAEARPDAVTIVTPHTMHFEHGMQAIEAGCHVLMEKPMVTDSTQARQLAQAVEKAGKIFVVGYNTPCTPAFEYIRNVIRGGELGKLELVSGWQTQDWRRLTTGTWRQEPELSGGGQMYDSGAHMFNSLVWSVEQPIETVYALADNIGTAVDINGIVNIRFANGVLATMAIGGNCPPDGAGMHFIFDSGRIDVDGWTGKWIKVFKGQKEIEPELQGEANTPNDNFIDAVLGRADQRTSPTNGVIQSQLMDAIYESAASGQPARPQN